MFLINGMLITHCTLWLTSYNIHMTLVTSNQRFGHAWAHIPKMIVLIWRNIWCLSSGKKSTSSFPFRLRYCIDIANLLFWVLGYAWLHTLKVILSTWRKFLHLSSYEKLTSSPTFFWKYCKDNANFLFWVLWACLAVDTKIDSISQNDTINLRKTLMFTYMPKINFIIHFFLRYYIKRILQFDWPAAFLLITQEPEFFQICDW